MWCSRLTIAAGLLAAFSASTFAADETWTRVGEALGKPGTELPSGVYRVALPRTDLKVILDGIEIKPGFALGGWLAFEKISRQGMVMGDLVLTEDEVNPALQKLLAGGIRGDRASTTTCCGNQPFTMYMHVLRRGRSGQARHGPCMRPWPKARPRSRQRLPGASQPQVTPFRASTD